MRKGFVRITRGSLALLIALITTPLAGAWGQDAGVSITTTLEPKTLTVAPGTTVTWTNNDGEEHRMRSQTGPEEFDSGNLATGESYSFNFALEGTYTYIDDRNDEDTAYHGTITVSATAEPPGDPGDPPPPAPPPPTSGDVSIVDRTFQPASLTVAAGATVTWANNDTEEHTVTATDSSWDSGIFDTGGTYSRSFADPGTYNYFCIIHPDMTGAITVTGSGGEPPPPPDPDPPPPPDTDPPPPPADGDVNIVDFAFSPETLTVSQGSTVTWSNTGAAPHTVTANGGSFDSGVLFAGDTYSRTFPTSGTYDYLCTLHPEMTATVVVTGADGEPPPPPPPGADPPGGGSSGPGPAPPPGGIAIVDSAFSPSSRTVSTGTTLVWTNTGALPHTVTSSTGIFDSGFLSSGQSYSRTFTQPGTFGYVCTIHPGMTGTINVVGEPTGDPPPEEGGVRSTGETQLRPYIDPPPPPSSGDATVSIIDNDYSPGDVTIAAGGAVRWVNDGELPHTVAARDESFVSDFLLTGDTFVLSFTTPGTYEYFCTIHPEMIGTVTVTEGDGSVAAAPVEAPATTTTEAAPEASAASENATAADGRVFAAMLDNSFRPRTLQIETGQTVLWTNEGELPHTVTAADESWDSDLVLPGGTFERTFGAAGSYSYVCTIHEGMTGVVEVSDPGQTIIAAAVPTVATAPLSTSVAIVMAGSIIAAVAVFAVGMARFGQAAARER